MGSAIIGEIILILAIIVLIIKVPSVMLSVFMIGLVICIHEFGHFIMARVNGVIVEEFSIGFGPRLVSRKIRGTRWSLKLLPLGGSCMMKGEDTEENEGEGTFKSKSIWQRISIIFAGPFFNFLLAFVLACIIIGSIGYDAPTILTVDSEVEEKTGLAPDDEILKFNGHSISIGREMAIYEQLDDIPKTISLTVLHDGEEKTVEYDSVVTKRYLCGITYKLNPKGESNPMVLNDISGAAKDAGLQQGDIVIAVNGTKIDTPEAFQEYTQEKPIGPDPVTFQIQRDGAVKDITLTPKYSETVSFGFVYNVDYRTKVNPLKVIKYGAVEVEYWIKATVKSLGYMLKGKAEKEDVGGAIRVVSEMSNVVEESKKQDGIFYAFLNLINWGILVSANLGVMNLLPIPALDGGRLLFLLIELIIGHKVNPKVEGVITFICFALLMLLMIFIMYNDIVNVFGAISRIPIW